MRKKKLKKGPGKVWVNHNDGDDNDNTSFISLHLAYLLVEAKQKSVGFRVVFSLSFQV